VRVGRQKNDLLSGVSQLQNKKTTTLLLPIIYDLLRFKMNATTIETSTMIKAMPTNFGAVASEAISAVIDCEDNVIQAIVDAVAKCYIDVPQKVVKQQKAKSAPKLYSKVSAYNMWKKAKTGGDWKTMNDEDKAVFQAQADEENKKREAEAIRKAEAGESDSDSGSSSGQRKTTGFILWKKAKLEGSWKTMTEEEKQPWNDQAAELNKDIVSVKKPKKEDPTYDSYKVATRYLKSKKEVECYTWKQLPLEAKTSWDEFVRTKLIDVENKQLKRELIISGAETHQVMFAKTEESKKITIKTN
jgi:hypothetical protein